MHIFSEWSQASEQCFKTYGSRERSQLSTFILPSSCGAAFDLVPVQVVEGRGPSTAEIEDTVTLLHHKSRRTLAP